MNEAAIRQKVAELVNVMTAPPFVERSGKPQGQPQGIYHSETTGKDASIETCLDQLRLQAKYMMFDLEATRRENRYLRQMLETRHKRGDLDDHADDGRDLA